MKIEQISGLRRWLLPAALFGLAEGLVYWPDLALLGRPALGPLALFDAGTLLGGAALWVVCSATNRLRFAPRAGWAAVALAGLGSFLVLARL